MKLPIVVLVVAVAFRLISAVTDDPTCDAPPIIKGATQSSLRNGRQPLGTSITYQCEFGYVSRGSKGFQSRCQLDAETERAEWSNPEVSCIPRSCGDPGFVPNADRIGDVFTFPNQVQFQCHEGHRLQGLATRYCQASGEWSGKLPECNKISCSRPRDLENGRLTYSSLEFGAEIKYECNRGFILKDHQSRVCSGDGTWSNKDPVCIEATCEIPEKPDHGAVQLLGDPKVNSIAIYTCEEGRLLVGASASKCLITGQWTFPTPKCFRPCSIYAVDAGFIGRFENVRISRYRTEEQFVKIDIGTDIKHGESVDLLCNEGFSAGEAKDGQREMRGVECNDRQWSRTLQCKSSSCLGDPPGINHGYPVINKRTHGHAIYYRCHDEFVKSKSGHVECVYGQWTGYTPECVDGESVRCFLKDLNIDGVAKPNFQYIEHKTGFSISCLKGYKLSRHRLTIGCVLGQWKVPQNPCIEENCVGEPPQILHGKVTMSSPIPGSEVNYECDSDFQMKGSSTVQCRLGEWIGNPPSCIDKNCAGEPPQILHGKVTMFSPNPGSEVQYECDLGFQMRGSSTVQCHLGEWIGNPPSCVDTTIKPPTPNLTTPSIVSEDASVQEENCFCSFFSRDTSIAAAVQERALKYGDEITKGSKATIKCKDSSKYQVWPNGMVFYGVANLTCTVCERWETDKLPFCTDLREGAAWIGFDNENLKLRPGGAVETRIGEEIDVFCHTWNVGYPGWNSSHLRYVEMYSTTRSGEWIRYNTLLVMTEIRQEHAGRYQCSAKNRHGDPYRKTILDLIIPDAVVRCTLLDEKSTFNIEYNDGQNINSVAHYSCKEPSQVLSGSESRTCQETGDWSDSEPVCTDATVKCEVLDEKDTFDINYSDDQKLGSVARYLCKDSAQSLSGSDTRTCQETGEWSELEPICEDRDVRCTVLNQEKSFNINYSNGQKVGSIARYACKDASHVLTGSETRICQKTGYWSNVKPSCVEKKVVCPRIDGKGKLSITYSDWTRPVHTVATLTCRKSEQWIRGTNKLTCQANGDWSGEVPVCIDITCPVFQSNEVLKVSYSNENKALSFAKFQCLVPTTMLGNSSSMCRFNGTWSNPPPVCEAPGCTIEDLMMSAPEGLVPDMEGVTSDMLPVGTELRLLCEENLVLIGTKTAMCGPLGKWDVGNAQCVIGCYINTDDVRSQLIIEPIKENYRFGEFVVLRCPDGHKLTTDVQKVMCIGSSWSDPVPECEEVEDAET